MNYSVKKLKWAALIATVFSSFSAYGFEIKGDLIQGGFATIVLDAPGQVTYQSHQMVSDAEGRVLIAFGRDDKAEQSLIVIYDSGKTETHAFSIAAREYDVQRINGLPKNKVTPDKKTQDRIWQDILKAKAARKIDLPTPYFDSGFRWPVDKGVISGIYGSQRILNGHPRRPHLGVDVAAPEGTPLKAPADGQITLVENMELSGHTVMIDHGYGLRSTVIHLHKVDVKKGDQVKKGQIIGQVGMTGRATGPHVHWGMSWFNVRLDPGLVVYGKDLTKGYQVDVK